MEEITSLILDGCKLASDLEQNLPSLAQQPRRLSYICEEIIKAFDYAKERLDNGHNLEVQQQQNVNDGSLLKRLRTSSNYYYSHPLDTTQAHILAGTTTSHELVQSSGTGQVQPMNISVSTSKSISTDSSSQQRPRKRKDDGTTFTKRMPAPQIGNTEMPPEDGHTWRKYGQKEILGTKFPRSYYRCTHQKMYSCPAKKQVQRDNEDHNIFIVTYRGNHTCVMSNTAPSALAPISASEMSQLADHHQIMMSQTMNIGPQSSTTSSTGLRWFSTDVIRGEDHQSTSTSTRLNYGKEVIDHHELPVVDIAAAMFNTSGSSSTNSMDFLFTSLDDNYKLESDKKSG